MPEKLINMDISEIKDSNNARLLFLYLYYNNGNNLDIVSNKMLEIGNLEYIQYMLRVFKVKNIDIFIDFILKKSDSPRYLYNVLYDVDYLEDRNRIKLINRIIKLDNDRYTIKAFYYYFNILKKFNDNIFNKAKKLIDKKLNIDFNKDNYLKVLENLIYSEDYKIDYKGFTNNCFKGRNGYIPSLIVCHINSTYASALEHFYNEKTDVSAHYVIRRDGFIKQVVSLDDSSWANGTSLKENSDVYHRFSTIPLIRDTKDNANYFTFSIEHESFDGSLTDKQLESSIKVMKKIIRYLKDKYNYDFIIDRNHIIGHDEVNPIVRTKCPGKLFPYDRIIKELKKEIYDEHR